MPQEERLGPGKHYSVLVVSATVFTEISNFNLVKTTGGIPGIKIYFRLSKNIDFEGCRYAEKLSSHSGSLNVGSFRVLFVQTKSNLVLPR
jgi:hypothetical protein